MHTHSHQWLTGAGLPPPPAISLKLKWHLPRLSATLVEMGGNLLWYIKVNLCDFNLLCFLFALTVHYFVFMVLLHWLLEVIRSLCTALLLIL